MKPRPPGTIADAVTKIMGALTADGAAKAVGKSAALVRQWADPDKDALPSFSQAVALDRAYQAAGHGRPPLLDIYRRQLQPAPTINIYGGETFETFRDQIVNLQAELGELAADSQAASKDGTLTMAERATLSKDLTDLLDAAFRMRAVLDLPESKS